MRMRLNIVMAFFSVLFLVCLLNQSSARLLGQLTPFKASVPVCNVTVFNAFINQNVIAMASFGKNNNMDQISYGNSKTAPLYSNGEDYVIQFIQLPTGGTNNNLSECHCSQA